MMINKFFMKSVNRITKDFKQRELLPLKLVFFVQASTMSVLYPYLTIHMRELGISVEEAAIMSAVIPVIGIIMPPLAGMVADKIGNFKLLLAFFSLIGGVAAPLLLLVPVGRIMITYPERVVLDVGCGSRLLDDGSFDRGPIQLGLFPDIPCELTSGLNESESNVFNLNTTLESCGFVCRSSSHSLNLRPEFLQEETESESPSDPILGGRSYVIKIKTDAETKSYHYNLAKGEVPKKQTKEDALSHRIMANDGNLERSIRRVAPYEYFLPAMGLSNMTCEEVDRDPTKSGGRFRREENETVTRYVCFFKVTWEEENGDNSMSVVNKSLTFGVNKMSKHGDDFNGLDQFVGSNVNWTDSKPGDVTCDKSNLKRFEEVSASVFLHNPENNLEILETFHLSKCEPRCLVSTLRKTICSNMKREVVYDPQLTFWIYLIIRVFIGIIGSTSFAMYEVAVIAILREQNADYGLQRIYALIGMMISSPLSGLLIDYASQGQSQTDFRPAFYLYAGLKISTSILMLFINLEFKQAATNVIRDAITVLKNLEIIALLVACFVFGTAWGYIESFLFWFLEDLGGTRSLMGITITVGGIAGIPLLVLSGPIIDKIGHANVLFIGFIFYAIRLVGYSLIYNPYHCLFFEAMESITSSLAITASVTYAAKLSTTTTDGSIQGLVGGVYFGVGRGAGSLIGGYLMKAFGTRPTYRIFAVFTIITGIMYYLFNQFYIRKRPQSEGNEICKKEPKSLKNLESGLKIITEKPKEKNLENGTIQSDNNNQTDDKNAEKMARTNDGYTPSENEEKKENEKENKKRENQTESHDNPGFAPDEHGKNESNKEENKKKEE